MRPAPPALLSPRSVALIGASDDAAKTASRPLAYLRQAGFGGEIYPVARRETVLGARAWPSLSDLPAVPDHAFLLLPTEGVLRAVAECVALGVPVVTVLASGFSEGGAEGRVREGELKLLVAGSGTRLVGPSSIGVVNLHNGLLLTANAAFAEPDLPTGGLFVASHSGSLIGALLSRGKAAGVGFAGLVSVGNEVDLTLGEICAATLDDPDLTAYALFLETLRGAADLREFALGAAARGKSVVAYKLGRTEAAAELALGHTGALAGEDDIAEAFLRDCGIARVGTFEALYETSALLPRLAVRPSGSPRPAVAIVTTTGGGAAMVVDQLGLRDIEVRAPSAETAARLKARGVVAEPGRIVDLTLAGARYDVMRATLETLLEALEFDLVVAVVGSSARFQPELAVRPVIDCAEGGARLAAFLVPDAPNALRMLSEAGVPAFRTPESCADAIAAALHRRPARTSLSRIAERGAGRTLDEFEAYQVLERLGVPHAPAVAVRVGAVGPADLPFGFPVAVKALHPALTHKTDAGGVALNVASALDLAAAAQRIVASVNARRPDLTLGRVLVQPMVRGLGEVLLGYRLDAEVGPIVLLAAGGVLTEIYKDRSVRLAPVSLETAREMIGEVRALKALDGYRGQVRGDLEALAQAVVALSSLASSVPAMLEFEVNPLMVLETGVMAVDALGQVTT